MHAEYTGIRFHDSVPFVLQRRRPCDGFPFFDYRYGAISFPVCSILIIKTQSEIGGWYFL